MRNLIILLNLVVLFTLSCEKESINRPETSIYQHPQPLVVVQSEETLKEKYRVNLVNKILECLRNPKEKHQKVAKKSEEKGLQGALGVGVFREIEINYTNEDVLTCGNYIIYQLPEIFKKTKQLKVRAEIVRIFELIDCVSTIPYIINLIYFYSDEYNPTTKNLFELLTIRLKKYGHVNYINTLYPLLDIDNESVQIAAVTLFRKIRPTASYDYNYLWRKAHQVKSRVVKLHLLWTVSEIENDNRQYFVDYMNELLKTQKNDDDYKRAKTLRVVRQTVPPSTLELLFKLFEDELYTDSQDYIDAMAGYYDDQRVKDLFFKILKDDDYVIKFKMAVVNCYAGLKDSSVTEYILKITDQEMSKKYESVVDEGFSNPYYCLDALANNGDVETIMQLQKLKSKHKSYEVFIDKTIKKIENRLKE